MLLRHGSMYKKLNSLITVLPLYTFCVNNEINIKLCSVYWFSTRPRGVSKYPKLKVNIKFLK